MDRQYLTRFFSSVVFLVARCLLSQIKRLLTQKVFLVACYVKASDKVVDCKTVVARVQTASSLYVFRYLKSQVYGIVSFVAVVHCLVHVDGLCKQGYVRMPWVEEMLPWVGIIIEGSSFAF